jgi:cyclophilin family peptidyl-prolyl cis-trans isomerase
MGDYLDKETKQFLLIFAGIMLFLFFVYPRISDNLMTYDFSKQLTPLLSTSDTTSRPANTITTIDQTKNYSATVSTSQGNFVIDLFEKDAPKNVANFLTNANSYANASLTAQKDFLFKVDVKSEPNTRVEDEINADYLLLDRIKVRDAKFIRDTYDPNDPATTQFAPSNLSKYEDFTVKEFYSEVLGYTYNPELTTVKATKYIVYMASNGPAQNKVDFFVLMTNNAPQVDGRFTPVGQVTSGFDVLDKINESSNMTVRSVVVQAK